MPRKLQADLLLAACSVVWGATFVVVKLALSDASVFVFLSLRFLLAAVVLALMERRHLRSVSAGILRAGILLGCLLFVGFALQTIGLTLTTPSKSAFITGIFVVLVPLFLAVFGRKPVSRSVWIGVFTAVAGLYLLTAPPSGLANLNLGDVLTFGCAVIYAVHIIAIGHYAPRYSPGMLVFIQVTVTGLLSAVAVPVLSRTGWEAPRLVWTPGLVWAILATGLLATVGTISVQVWVQRNTDSSHVALLLTLEPVFAGLTSYVFAGERLGPRALAGAALILSGILIAELTGATAEVSLHERRRTPRYGLKCAIEVTDIPTGVCVAAAIEDCGLYGCFVKTSTPFAIGRAVALKIMHDGRTLAATGEVSRIVPDEGMGVAFGAMTPADHAVLAGWLARDPKLAATIDPVSSQ